MAVTDHVRTYAPAPALGRALAPRLIPWAAGLADVFAILLVAVLTGAAWHALIGDHQTVASFLEYGSLLALIYCGVSAARGDYALTRQLGSRPHSSRVLYLWTAAFLVAFAVGFVTKSSSVYSRGAVALCYLAGLVVLVALRVGAARLVRRAADEGRIAVRRVMLVGEEADVLAFEARRRPGRLALDVVGAAFLRDGARGLDAELERAVELARLLRPDDVVVVAPWSAPERIERVLDALLTAPAEIHLAPEPVLDRFEHAELVRLGRMSTLQLTRAPLGWGEVAAKRTFDLVAAAAALVALAPVLLLIAAAIRLESPGPVLFRQRRFGFNQRAFRIVKFRTMRVLEDGPDIRQVGPGDDRLTGLGRLLRRFNLDELPQLINVVAGDMSLVGPRPHAVAHDLSYERRIALYARRHNVKPGITGWAQVNGWRGPTRDDAAMRARVEHDLWYIDNWSFLLDLKILLLTLVSPKAYRNAG
jgi:Undecaprenyl-phosphate glucose phosphotransferase